MTTRRQIIQRELNLYEDGCDHPKTMLVVPQTGGYDCEGGTFSLECLYCGQEIVEGVVYE